MLEYAMQPTAGGQSVAGLGTLAEFSLGSLGVTVVTERDTVWAVIGGRSGAALALRLLYCPGGISTVEPLGHLDGERLRFDVEGEPGRFRVVLHADDGELAMLRASVSLVPSKPVELMRLPRDLFVLGEGGSLHTVEGRVEAAQRGFNGGLVYFHVDEPALGTVLYLQNVTALNDYFLATGTKPDGAVGGEWPELGYRMPVDGVPGHRLEEGVEIVLSEPIIVFDDEVATAEQDSALRFLRMVAAAYPHLGRPSTDMHDWPARAERTLRDLEESPHATVEHYGHTYLHPYTAAEYPDVMVQCTVLSALGRYADWTGHRPAVADALESGLDMFYDPALPSVRRYLPNVGADKDADAVDSWYLYHPLVSLAQMALAGNAHAGGLFTGSLEFAISVARHFDYLWPIQFNVRTFEVITAARDGDGNGQTDVGGIYAWVMLQAYELTGDDRYLEEARTAIDASRGMRFNMEYQANLTAWGAAACIRLWRATGLRTYLRQSYVYLGSFVHNCELWESQLGFARDYPNFFGATCLHDAQYIATFECSDSYAAFQHCLREGGDDLDSAARFLVSEFCTYVLDRAWYYYPDSLPAGSLATECRNGFIDPDRSFPLEDLYADGQPPGQVGQEIYGCGSAFIFAAEAFHRIEGAPFTLYCDHPIDGLDVADDCLGFRLLGSERGTARIALLMPDAGHRVPRLRVDGSSAEPSRHDDGRIEYVTAGRGSVEIDWS